MDKYCTCFVLFGEPRLIYKCFQGTVQEMTIIPDPQAAYDTCEKYCPECNIAYAGRRDRSFWYSDEASGGGVSTGLTIKYRSYVQD